MLLSCHYEKLSILQHWLQQDKKKIKSRLVQIEEVPLKLDGLAPLITVPLPTSFTPLSSTMQNLDKIYYGRRRLYPGQDL